MSARIRSTINFLSPVDEASRDDLTVGDVITTQSLDAATTYAWALVYVPDGSAATFSGSLTAVSPGSFTVDLVGPYLVRLITNAGLASESTQYVRLRALTDPLGLKLVAAGERRDETGVIPVDVDPEGWANEQNYNLQRLEAALSYRTLTSGEALSANDVVGFDATVGGGRLIQADATGGAEPGRTFASGVALDAAAGAGEQVRVTLLAGSLVVATFDVAPVAADQGSPVYLHTTPGQVSLTAPVASGAHVVRVGILHDASTQTVQFFPQFVEEIP